MIRGKWYAPSENLPDGVLDIRQSVLGFTDDPLDAESWNVLVLDETLPVATGRIWWKDGSFWLGSLAVLPRFRGQHLGDLVLRLLLYKALNHSAKEVRLQCPAQLAGFFTRLGFQPVSPEGAELVEMMIRGEMISLDSCANCPKQHCARRQALQD